MDFELEQTHFFGLSLTISFARFSPGNQVWSFEIGSDDKELKRRVLTHFLKGEESALFEFF